MIHAYSELYVEEAQRNLAELLDWGCNHVNVPLATIFSLFAESEIGQRFSNGDPAIIAGKSGVELALEILSDKGLLDPSFPIADAALDCFSRSPEYWTGWVVAYFQWSEGLSFAQMGSIVDINDIWSLYHPYHEMDILQTRDAIIALARENRGETNLKQIRTSAGLSQGDLARLSGISVRVIQHYEQRQKCINKASAETVLRLSTCLCCSPYDLMEPLGKERYEYALVKIPISCHA